jgi:hypothetical protein
LPRAGCRLHTHPRGAPTAALPRPHPRPTGVQLQRAHVWQGRGVRRGPARAHGAVSLLHRGAQEGAAQEVRAAVCGRGRGARRRAGACVQGRVCTCARVCVCGGEGERWSWRGRRGAEQLRTCGGMHALLAAPRHQRDARHCARARPARPSSPPGATRAWWTSRRCLPSSSRSRPRARCWAARSASSCLTRCEHPRRCVCVCVWGGVTLWVAPPRRAQRPGAAAAAADTPSSGSITLGPSCAPPPHAPPMPARWPTCCTTWMTACAPSACSFPTCRRPSTASATPRVSSWARFSARWAAAGQCAVLLRGWGGGVPHVRPAHHLHNT